MRANKILIIAAGLALVLGAACKRNAVHEPSPVGPSTLATVLKVSASPNVIVAGARHAGTTIAASLRKFDGTPIVGRSVTFEVCNEAGMQIDVGFFEGHESVLTKQTDGGGNISLTYYGPLESDIAASTIVDIWATAAAEGDETIQNFAPVSIIRDTGSTSALIEVLANPNVLNAGAVRQSAVVTAVVTAANGAPLANRKVYFEINDETNKRSAIGYFKEANPVATAVTNSSGRASVTYFAPLKTEVPRSLVLHIWATTSGEGDPFVQNYVEVFIIR
jgi:hypothetical protein